MCLGKGEKNTERLSVGAASLGPSLTEAPAKVGMKSSNCPLVKTVEGRENPSKSHRPLRSSLNFYEKGTAHGAYLDFGR